MLDEASAQSEAHDVQNIEVELELPRGCWHGLVEHGKWSLTCANVVWRDWPKMGLAGLQRKSLRNLLACDTWLGGQVRSGLTCSESTRSPGQARSVNAMDERELVEPLDDLEALLLELGFASIVEQERRAASEGRVTETTRSDLPPGRKRGTPRPEVGDVRLASLSTRERVAMLIDFVADHFDGQPGAPFPASFTPDRAEGSFPLRDPQRNSVGIPHDRVLQLRLWAHGAYKPALSSRR